MKSERLLNYSMFDVSALNKVLDKIDSLNQVLESSTPESTSSSLQMLPADQLKTMLRDLPSTPPPPAPGWTSRANIHRHRLTCPAKACLWTMGGWRDTMTAHYTWSPGLEPYCCRKPGNQDVSSFLALWHRRMILKVLKHTKHILTV